MWITVEDLHDFLLTCDRGEGRHPATVVAPLRDPADRDAPPLWGRPSGGGTIDLDGYRLVDPVKSFFYRFRETVYPADGATPRRIIAGVKACDLRALRLLDAALLEQGFADPGYRRWRDHTLVIAADCSDAGPTCHCTLLGDTPWPEEGFDLALARVGDHYRITVGSPRGRDLTVALRGQFPLEETPLVAHQEVEARRQTLAKTLAEANARFRPHPEERLLDLAEMDAWAAPSEDCVGCGACTNICPTCYCLILNDTSTEAQFRKERSIDSCQLHGYARVAGGGSPRPRMTERFRNRYLCKFCYANGPGIAVECVGCGRCIDACPAGIDFRAVVAAMSRAARETQPDVMEMSS